MSEGYSGRPKTDRDASIWGSRARTAAGSLFDRLALDEEETDVSASTNPVDAKIRSIKQNLGRILNARTGGAASAPRLGVSDFNDSTQKTNDMTKHIAASIHSCIQSYEPRVRDIVVTHIPDPDQPLNLHFVITGAVTVADDTQQIRVDVLMSDGRSCSLV